MAWQVLIAGIDFAQYVDLETFEIDNYLDPKSDKCTFTVTYPQGTMVRPKSRNELVVVNGTNSDGSPHHEFGGVIVQVDDVSDKPGISTYNVTARDYTAWLDRQVAILAVPTQDADLTIKQLISTYAPVFTTNHVQSSFPITQQYFNYETITNAINKITQLAQFIWYVDYYKDVHFAQLNDAPVDGLPNNTLDMDTMTDWFSTDSSNPIFTDDGTTIRNQVYLKGFEVASSNQVTRTITANGVDTVYPLLYKPGRPLKDSVSVTVGGTSYTVAYDMEAGVPGVSNNPGVAYINRTNMTVRFDTAPASGTSIVITMYYAYNPVVMVKDPVSQREIAAREGNGTGEYDYVITDAQLVSQDVSLAQDMGQLVLYKYAYPHISGEFNSFMAGWSAGQYFTLKTTQFMDGLDGAGQVTAYVLQVQKTIINNDNAEPMFQYKVTWSDSPYTYQG